VGASGGSADPRSQPEAAAGAQGDLQGGGDNGADAAGRPSLTRTTAPLQAGIKPNLAKLTLARRIAAIVLSMWKHEEVYDPARLKVATDKS